MNSRLQEAVYDDPYVGLPGVPTRVKETLPSQRCRIPTAGRSYNREPGELSQRQVQEQRRRQILAGHGKFPCLLAGERAIMRFANAHPGSGPARLAPISRVSTGGLFAQVQNQAKCLSIIDIEASDCDKYMYFKQCEGLA